MNLKNRFKRFWTLDVHNHEGFTLVELIIVIAILAILSTGAIAGYSAYVEKANITADKALISELKTVLTMNAYYEGATDGGYVVIFPGDDADASETLKAALADAYGANWYKALKLKYTGWEDDGILSSLLASDYNNIWNSPYMQNSSPDVLMNTVTALTGAAAEAFATVGGKESQLIAMLGKGFVDKLNAQGVSKDDPKYATIVSNMMVTHLAEEFSGDSEDESVGAQLARTYAIMYAFALTDEDAMAEMDTINENLAKADTVDDLWDSLSFSDKFADAFGQYYGTEGVMDNNMAAFEDIMKTVHSVSGQLTDYSDPKLFSSATVSNLLNDYTGAVSALANLNLNDTQKAELQAALDQGGVVVLVGTDGTVNVFPAAVEN